MFLHIPRACEHGQICIYGFIVWVKYALGKSYYVSAIPPVNTKNQIITVSAFLCTLQLTALLSKIFRLLLHCYSLPVVKYSNNCSYITEFWKIWNAQLILNTPINFGFFFPWWQILNQKPPLTLARSSGRAATALRRRAPRMAARCKFLFAKEFYNEWLSSGRRPERSSLWVLVSMHEDEHCKGGQLYCVESSCTTQTHGNVPVKLLANTAGIPETFQPLHIPCFTPWQTVIVVYKLILKTQCRFHLLLFKSIVASSSNGAGVL